ncbi:TPA: ClpXP protease specificity-enhancing factor [Vibrio cholerae]
MDIGQMTPRRPYLLRAFYDWLLENELTPHLVVDATLPGVKVPLEYVQDGQIILNVAPRAVGNLELGNDEVTFNARFGGRPHLVIVPIYAVQAIYARENGAGTMFEPEPAYLDMMDFPEEIHSDDSLIELESDIAVEHTEETSRPRGKPSLRVVK